eukprot:982162-Rhodomonas_salina.2
MLCSYRPVTELAGSIAWERPRTHQPVAIERIPVAICEKPITIRVGLMLFCSGTEELCPQCYECALALSGFCCWCSKREKEHVEVGEWGAHFKGRSPISKRPGPFRYLLSSPRMSFPLLSPRVRAE